MERDINKTRFADAPICWNSVVGTYVFLSSILLLSYVDIFHNKVKNSKLHCLTSNFTLDIDVTQIQICELYIEKYA